MDQSIWYQLLIAFTTALCQCGALKSTYGPISDDSNIFRPDLGCILFGELGCSTSCTVMCDMYGCQTFESTCIDDLYCECNEKYEISSSTTTTTEYNQLSFNKLWNYKITKSHASKKIRKKIFQYPETFDEILKILRDPHKTGLHVKRRLQDLHPKWAGVLELEPRQLGYVDNLIAGDRFDDRGMEEYLQDNLEPLIDQLYDELIGIRHKIRLASALDQIDEEGEIRQIIKQIALSNKDSLYDYATSHLKRNGFEVDEVDVPSRKRGDYNNMVTVYDTDQLILASVMEKLLDIKENDQAEMQAVKNTFSLSEEMTVGNEDLFDSEFNAADEDSGVEKSFILSDEMTVGKDDLYDADFGRSIDNFR